MLASLAWFWFLLHAIFADHQRLYEENGRLSQQVVHLNKYANEEQSNNQKVAQAQTKADIWRDAYIAATKGDQIPDRRIPESQREAIVTALREVAKNYHHPRIDIGRFKGDTESERYWTQIYQMFQDAGFSLPVPDDCITKSMRKNATDPPDLGLGEGLSVQIFVQKQGEAPNPRNKIPFAIYQAFNNEGVMMQQYPIGTGEPITDAKYPLVWVGIKKANWLAGMER